MNIRPRKRSSHVLMVGVAVALLSAISALGTAYWPSDTQAAALSSSDTSRHVTVSIVSASGADLSGKATIRDNGAFTTVNVRLSGDDGTYPILLRQGSCSEFAVMPDTPLSDAHPGRTSGTVVELPYDEMVARAWAITVLRPEAQLNSLLDPTNVVACGQVNGLAAGDANPDKGAVVEASQAPQTGVGSTIARHTSTTLTLALSGIAVLFCAVGMALRRREQRTWVPYPV